MYTYYMDMDLWITGCGGGCVGDYRRNLDIALDELLATDVDAAMDMWVTRDMDGAMLVTRKKMLRSGDIRSKGKTGEPLKQAQDAIIK